jgi:hypothetical protein
VPELLSIVERLAGLRDPLDACGTQAQSDAADLAYEARALLDELKRSTP